MMTLMRGPYIVPPVHEVLWRRIVRQDFPQRGDSVVLTFYPLRPEDV
jgi:hypothetical protein